jgi:hypothetical protein
VSESVVNALPEPDRKTHDEKEIIFDWELSSQGQTRQLTVMTVSYRPAGLDIEIGQEMPKRYDAVLTSQTELPPMNGAIVREIPFSGLLVHRGETDRFSKKEMGAFADEALARLSELYAAADPLLTSYFPLVVEAC